MNFFKKKKKSEEEIVNFVSKVCDHLHEKINMYAKRKAPINYEDVIQEAFSRFHNMLLNNPEKQFEGYEEVLRYFTKIINNLVIDHQKKNYRTTYTSEFPDKRQRDNSYDELETIHDFEVVAKKYHNPVYVEYFRLRLAGYSYQEISEKLNRSKADVKKGLFRIRKHFKKFW